MHNTSTALDSELSQQQECARYAAVDTSVAVLTDIYKEQVNIAIWQNELPNEVLQDVTNLMQQTSHLSVVMTSVPGKIVEHLVECNAALAERKALCEHIALVVDMFCTLFELKQVGLRLTRLDHAMCPKFHVDKVPCRLVTTFSGIATEWLAHEKVDRSKLGAGSIGIADEVSGIMQDPQDVQRLSVGDIALLKGEGWFDNQNGGAVHRSPAITEHEQRLLLTLDFVD